MCNSEDNGIFCQKVHMPKTKSRRTKVVSLDVKNNLSRYFTLAVTNFIAALY